MLRSQTLAAISALVVGFAMAHAGPPVQVRAVAMPPDTYLYGLSRWSDHPIGSSRAIDPNGWACYLAVQQRPGEEPGSVLVVANDTEYQIVAGPLRMGLTFPDPENWERLGAMFAGADTVFYLERKYAAYNEWLFRLHEATRADSSWTSETISQWTSRDFYDYGFSTNDLGEVAWVQNEYADEVGGPRVFRLMLRRDGTNSVVNETGIIFLTDVKHLFDNGTIIYEITYDGCEYWIEAALTREGVQPPAHVGRNFPTSNDVNGPVVHRYSQDGDYFGVRNFSDILWVPSGESITPPFTILEEDAGRLGRADPGIAINRPGRLLFTTSSLDGYVILDGPDIDSDRVLGPGSLVSGKPMSDVRVHALNDRDEILFRCLYQEPGAAEGKYLMLGTICPADVNRDGVFDNGDITDWITLYLEGSLRTDFNNDGLLDNGDIGEFITQFLKGC